MIFWLENLDRLCEEFNDCLSIYWNIINKNKTRDFKVCGRNENKSKKKQKKNPQPEYQISIILISGFQKGMSRSIEKNHST
jgi:hypothetical protein